MASEEAIKLSYSDFVENQAKYYNELLVSHEMSDVTLACEGYEVGAHKTIISASSLFFREIVKKSKHVNPYIYLKGVSKETLQALLEFIYVGEATICSENVEKLIDAGNELKIIGIIQEQSDTKNPKVKQKTNFNVADYVKIEPTASKDHEHLESFEVDFKDKEEDELYSKVKLEKEIEKRITAKRDNNGFKYYVCNVCNNEKKSRAKMKLHVETHLDGFSHKCKLCPTVKKTTRTLQIHMFQQHSKYSKSST